jgi:hypothetical protein
MIIYSNKYCTITYTSTEKLFHLKWLQQPVFKVLGGQGLGDEPGYSEGYRLTWNDLD